MKQISAGIIIYRKTPEGPKFLFLYHGGRYWNFPKGKLDGTERSFVAALREVKEETGLDRRDLFFKNYFRVNDRYIFTANKQKVFKIVIYYLAETRKKEIKISGEHQGYGWFNRREAQSIIIYPGLKNILKKAYDAIVSQKSLERRQKNTVR